MPLRFWREQGCAVVSFEGTYEPQAGLGAIEEALDAEPEPALGLLLDLTDSESFRGRSTDGLRVVAQFLSTRRDRFGSRLATVGGSDLAYGLLRMGTVFAADKGIESAVFRTRAEALAWLQARGGNQPPA